MMYLPIQPTFPRHRYAEPCGRPGLAPKQKQNGTSFSSPDSSASVSISSVPLVEEAIVFNRKLWMRFLDDSLTMFPRTYSDHEPCQSIFSYTAWGHGFLKWLLAALATDTLSCSYTSCKACLLRPNKLTCGTSASPLADNTLKTRFAYPHAPPRSLATSSSGHRPAINFLPVAFPTNLSTLTRLPADRFTTLCSLSKFFCESHFENNK